MKLRKPILLTLIGLGLCAIGVSVYLQYGKPYLREMEVQSQDEKRIADLGALNTALETILTSNATASTSSPQATYIGNANIVYISLPSATSTCAELDLPSLPDDWSYHCTTADQLTNTDGTGWLPFALEIATLPIDPKNSADTLNYYAFVTSPAGWEQASTTATTTLSNSSRPSQNATEGTAGQATTTVTVATTTQYVLTAVLDSKKYLKEKAQTDGGTDPIRYEKGERTLWTKALGLVAYWPMDRDFKYHTYSIIGGYDAQLLNTAHWVQGKDSHGGIMLNGENDYVEIPFGTTYKDTTISISLETEALSGVIISSIRYVKEKQGHDGYTLYLENGKPCAAIYAGSGAPTVSMCGTVVINDGQRHDLRLNFSNRRNRIVVDNKVVARNEKEISFSEPLDTLNTNVGRYNYIPSSYFKGTVRELAISRCFY